MFPPLPKADFYPACPVGGDHRTGVNLYPGKCPILFNWGCPPRRWEPSYWGAMPARSCLAVAGGRTIFHLGSSNFYRFLFHELHG